MRQPDGDRATDFGHSDQVEHPGAAVRDRQHAVVRQPLHHMLGRHSVDHETHHRNTLSGVADPFAASAGNAADLTTGTGGASGDFFQKLGNDFWTIVRRGSLVILGIVLIAVGGYWLASQGGLRR